MNSCDAPSRELSPTPRPFWVSFLSQSGTFELHTPWWISGATWEDDVEIDVICAALMAVDDEDVRAQVRAAHDDDEQPWFRFIEPRPEGWAPFCDRFQRADWMQWPESPARDGAPFQNQDNPNAQ